MPSSAAGRLAFVALVVLDATAVCSGARAQSGAGDDAQGEPPSAADAEACFTAAERSQPLMRDRKLRAAREALQVCARDVCPRVARTDCRGWLAEALRLQPSIVIAAHEEGDARGVHDVDWTRAIVDGNTVFEPTGGPLELDPGRHVIRLERAAAPPVEREVDVREGEKDRVVDFTWHEPAVVRPSSAVPPGVYVLGSVAAVALGVGAYFEVAGLTKRGELDSSCKPTRTCAQADVDQAHNLTRVGDLTLGAGVLLAAGAAVTYFTRPTEEPTGKAARWEWSVAPSVGGVYAVVRGAM